MEAFLAGQIKSLTIFCANLAIQKHMADLKDQQELLLALADLAIAAYGVDCTVARVMQHIEGGDAPVHVAMARIFAAERYLQSLSIAQKLVPSLSTGDELASNFAALDKFTFAIPTDLIALKRVVADYAVEMQDWNL